MPAWRVAEVEAKTDFSQWRVAEVGVATTAAAGAKLRVAEISVAVTLPAVPRWRVNSVEVEVAPAVVIAPFATLTVDAFASLSVTAKVPTGASATFAWRVISGGPVDLIGVGGTRVFVAPAKQAGTTLVLGVVATSAGVSSPEARATFVVLPHSSYRIAADGSLIPIPLPGRLAVAPAPSPAAFPDTVYPDTAYPA
jgi:hypothetical protein